jgi:hypothetical protein
MSDLVDLPIEIIVQGVTCRYEKEHHERCRNQIGPVIKDQGPRGYQYAHQEADDAHQAVAQTEQLDYPVHGAGLGFC